MSDRAIPQTEMRQEGARSRRERWVLVSGGLHFRGGMDRANAMLAVHLLERGNVVHAVAHHVDRALASHPGLRIHEVPCPAGSFALGEWLLGREGRAIASAVTAADPGAHVVVNGGGCCWGGVNWVHCVHHAWPCVDTAAPVRYRLKNRLVKAVSRHREARCLQQAKLIIANSERTRRDVLMHFGMDPSRVHAVPLGSDPDLKPPTEAERTEARREVSIFDGRPLVLFVGALGWDRNKGLDTLIEAWRMLSSDSSWDGQLIAAGGGLAGPWIERVRAAGLQDRIRLAGHTENIPRLLAAADLLVSPVRYEAFGLNVQEAVCRGVPAMVSRGAGVAESFPDELSGMLLPDPDDAPGLAARLRTWRSEKEVWRLRFRGFSARVRAYTWRHMSERFVHLVERVDS